MGHSGKTLFLDRPEGRLAYDVSGDGPLVVCVPGMVDVRSSYRHLAPALVEAGYRVATMDLRGHGESDTTFSAYDDQAAASDVLALIGHLDQSPAVVVGNSMGAAAATLVAADEPGLIEAIVMLGPFVRNPPTTWFQRAMMWLMLRRPWGVPAVAAFYRSLNAGVTPPDLGDHLQRIRAALRRPGAWAAVVRTTKTSHAQVTPRLAHVMAPTLVVMGERDPDFADPAAEARFIADALGGPTEIDVVPDAGHYPQAQRPDLVNPRVVGFLDQARRHA